jgi:hypothetical protein
MIRAEHRMHQAGNEAARPAFAGVRKRRDDAEQNHDGGERPA